MEYIIGIGVLVIMGAMVIYNIKKHEREQARQREIMAEIEENNKRIMAVREERRQRLMGTTTSNTAPLKTRTFEKRENKSTYVLSPTQSTQAYSDANSVTDTLVNAMILDAVMNHHNEPTVSQRYDARVESDTPDTPAPSTSYSSSSSDSSYSSSSRDSSYSSSYSSSSSDSSYSSSSSDSSYSSSSSSDW